MSASSMSDFANRLSEKAKQDFDWAEGDYINEEDGLIYCGRCHTPRQYRVQNKGCAGFPRVVHVWCECRRRAFGLDRDSIVTENGARSRSRLRRKSGIPPIYEDCTLSAWTVDSDNRLAYRACKKYIDTFPEQRKKGLGLMFWGNVGTGKSHAAATIGNACVAAGNSVIMVTFPQLLRPKAELSQEAIFLGDLVKADLLILDDLGTTRTTPAALERIFGIIDDRARAKSPTVITTNLSPDSMRAETDVSRQQLYNRVLSVCAQIPLGGRSRRREAKFDF